MKKLMAANWKMFKTADEAVHTAEELVDVTGVVPQDREVLVFSNFISLSGVAKTFSAQAGFFCGAQNVYPAKEGAFTGEISPDMITAAGAGWVLTGHSERRSILGESSEFVGQKTAFCLENGLNVVLCIGETLEERESGRLESVLRDQLSKGLAEVPVDIAPDRIAVAYEPVWAIGTGKVAGPAEIRETHAGVRSLLRELLPAAADNIRILYGGSVKPDNASEIISLDNVDGVLVGGASLQAESFSRIILA
ncbi:triose-phosphate isomerase [Oleidesulfovibrio sp.]|uniref:triose-phosphate isomerase n=1 Tax=Oleidesulfovibrio sp. TaxID=2909707 RepID=UPI003A8A5F4A